MDFARYQYFFLNNFRGLVLPSANKLVWSVLRWKNSEAPEDIIKER
jgi:hypothetical protein